MTTAGHSDLNLSRRLLLQARPYWRHVAGIFLISLLSAPLSLLTPLPLKIAVDSGLGTHPLPGALDALTPAAVGRSGTGVLVLAACLLVAVALLGQLQGLALSLLSAYTGEKMVLGFRAALFARAQRLSLSYHDANGTVDAAYRIQHDAPAIQHLVIDGFIPLVTAVFTLAGMIYCTIRLDWQLALVALTVAPVLFLVSRACRLRMRKQSRETKKLESSALAVVQEVLGALRVVKAFGQEWREQERLVRRCREGMRARLRLLLLEGGFGLVVGLTTAAGSAAVLLIGILHVQSGALTLGELLLVMAYLSQLYAPLKTLSRKAASLQSHLASAERAFALLDATPDVPERPDARPLGRAEGAVVFRNVSFAYKEGRPVLDGVSFEVPPGTRVGVVGVTGTGKTTLAGLLTRFYDPAAGQVLLDGVDLRDYRLADLRNQYAVVLQEPVLFSTSLAENIAYARPGATEEEVVEAARAARIHDFIARLPDGYQTPVGERGLSLSGGERQRVALARAFLKDAPILILDEPTSAVDLRTEAEIVEAMERLMRGRTAFLITHRPSTLKGCDVLLAIEHGRLRVTPNRCRVTVGEGVADD
ncbi:MAG TPA: ABC transporter ATP-binding protein [Fimbriiglobus sp.]|jgi:ATP-binding cassette subfamily B protein|nr:ABC transporter ATP-binding protein [Fimbriiglobus sp.]